MKVFDSKLKNIMYLAYRVTKPVLDPVQFATGLVRYPKYIYDLARFNKQNGFKKFSLMDLYPILDEKSSFTTFDHHYFFQQLWVFENVMQQKPSKHVDVASTYQMSGYLSTIVPTEFVDIRPIDTDKPNLKIIRGSVLQLPYESNSLESVSCLHVLEHIGLGRYDNEITTDGFIRGLKELMRVVKPNGYLYISTPIGKERVCFNAHRISDAREIVNLATDMKLEQFNIVDDNGTFKQNFDLNQCSDFHYALGMFTFKKTAV